MLNLNIIGSDWKSVLTCSTVH